MSIISIQSQVIYGHVGNSVAVFPLQFAGLQVAAIPTVLLSNHPAYPSVYGTVMSAELVSQLLTGLEERDIVATTRIIVTGYIGSAAIAMAAAAFINRAKAKNPAILYLCDPVMGDFKPGFYVEPDVREAIIEHLLPLADIITPNRFEFDVLTGTTATGAPAILAAARRLGKALVLVTGSPAGPETLDTYAITADAAWRVTSPRLTTKASGTGDLLSALFVAARLNGKSMPDALAAAVSGIYGVLEATVSADSQELAIITHADRLYPGVPRFSAEAI